MVFRASASESDEENSEEEEDEEDEPSSSPSPSSEDTADHASEEFVYCKVLAVITIDTQLIFL